MRTLHFSQFSGLLSEWWTDKDIAVQLVEITAPRSNLASMSLETKVVKDSRVIRWLCQVFRLFFYMRWIMVADRRNLEYLFKNSRREVNAWQVHVDS